MAAGIHSVRRLAFLAALAACTGAGAAAALWAEDATLEYRVKAAFLLNFTRFIEWPAGAFSDAGAPFTICILGPDPFGKALDDIVEGEAAGDRKLTVRRITEEPPPKSCQMLFMVPGGKDISKTLEALGPGVLTVGEEEAFTREGGAIAFVIDHHRVRFVVNVAAAGRAGLKLSSRLLSVARAIEK